MSQEIQEFTLNELRMLCVKTERKWQLLRREEEDLLNHYEDPDKALRYCMVRVQEKNMNSYCHELWRLLEDFDVDETKPEKIPQAIRIHGHTYRLCTNLMR